MIKRERLISFSLLFYIIYMYIKYVPYNNNIKNKSYLLTESNREELKIEFINKIDDFVVNQYYINCATENGIIGYPIQYCPICGKNLNKS